MDTRSVIAVLILAAFWFIVSVVIRLDKNKRRKNEANKFKKRNQSKLP